MTSLTYSDKMSEKIPNLTSKGDAMGACFEIHIFMGNILTFSPGTPFEQVKQTESYKDFDKEAAKYTALVEKWNREVLPVLKERDEGRITHTQMKKPKLILIFRNGSGEIAVGVCQSARHVWATDMISEKGKENSDKQSLQSVLELCHEDAEYFRSNGMVVLREKIEASVHGINGIPQTDEQAIASGSYFEFHIKTQLLEPVSDDIIVADDESTSLKSSSIGNAMNGDESDDDSEEDVPEATEAKLVTQEEENELRALADKLSREFGIPIPLSYNLEKNENNTKNGGCQRFLNARFRDIGMQKIEVILHKIKKAIAATRWPDGSRKFKPLPMISEFIVYDTNTKMDHGWIDYTSEESAALQRRLQTASTAATSTISN